MKTGELFKGQFMEEVLDIIEKKAFIDNIKELEEIDEYVRDLTPLEKGLVTYIDNVASKIADLVWESRDEMVDGIPLEEYNKLTDEILLLTVNGEAANWYLGYLLKFTAIECQSIVMLRAGFQVVKHDFHTCQCFVCRDFREKIDQSGEEPLSESAFFNSEIHSSFH
jgi:hypothetical protein